jgi:polyphosphate kinase
LIDKEIKEAKKGNKASITLKLNSLSDISLIDKISSASAQGVEVNLIIRGIYSTKKQLKKNEKKMIAISIVDEFLEHARVLSFHNKGEALVYISSADFMVRNLDHRIEVACPIFDLGLKKELLDILNIQLQDNVKARILDTELNNRYVPSLGKRKSRSQIETYNYLIKKQAIPIREISRH